MKYTRAGTVAFSATYRDGCVEAAVEDTGIGIAPDDLGRVFENFFRSAGAKESGEVGTGLGLAIVQRLVERAGGTITVASEPGRGTRFVVRLPAVSPPTPPSSPSSPAPAVPAAVH